MLECPALPPPLHLLGAVLKWDALSWGDRLSILRMAPSLQAARRELARSGRVAVGGDTTVSNWLRDRGQTEKLTAWLWEPLALAALNQAPDEALATPFVRVLAEMFGPDRTASAIALPIRPLHAMYAEPARAFIERRGGSVRTGALARVLIGRNAHHWRRRARRAHSCLTCHLGGAVVRHADTLRQPGAATAGPARGGCGRDDVEADRHREPVVRPPRDG